MDALVDYGKKLCRCIGNKQMLSIFHIKALCTDGSGNDHPSERHRLYNLNAHATPSLQAELKGIENWVEIKDDEGNEEWGYEYVPPNIPLVLAGELLHG